MADACGIDDENRAEGASVPCGLGEKLSFNVVDDN